jgi:hypothetical protein
MAVLEPIPAYVVPRAGGRSRARTTWSATTERRAEAILEALRTWAAQYGEPPTIADWEPSRARRQRQEWRIERWESGDWPSARMVRNHFGTMSAAVRAAGLSARRSPTRARRHLPSSDAVLDAMRAWTARYGEPPAMTDWDPARARQAHQERRIARFYDGDWPSIATVRHHFGSLNRAVVAAGLRPRVPGERTASGRRPSGRTDGPLPERPQQVLALRVRSVAVTAAREDRRLLAEALGDLAVAAYSWADEIRAHED